MSPFASQALRLRLVLNPSDPQLVGDPGEVTVGMEFLTDPWQWWVQPFTGDPILQRAVLAGLLTVLVTSVVGTWVVLRGVRSDQEA